MAVFINMVVGDKVKRNQPGDYTHGREGIIVEFAKIDDRVRVRWTHEADGRPIITLSSKSGNGIRTWVARNRLILMVGGEPKFVGLPKNK